MTKLVYMEAMDQLEHEATITSASRQGDRDVVTLDETIFYPQGGGQPYDRGLMERDGGRMSVAEVRFAQGKVLHFGSIEGELSEGMRVGLRIDRPRRELHTRIHSAGHVVDMAVTSLKLGWIPGKGYHFPEGPYVEYSGSLDGVDKDVLKDEIEGRSRDLVAASVPTSIRFMTREEMSAVCHFVPEYVPEGKPSRVVFYGEFGVPCGGTHVSNLSKIGPVTIRKIKASGAIVRVSYDVARGA